MKKFLKILGAAALVAGFAPYRFEVDEETGTQKVQALLWSITRTPAKDDGKPELALNFGPQAFTQKEEEETHLFSDELTVDYGANEDGEDAAAAEEAPESPETPEAPETPETPEADAEE